MREIDSSYDPMDDTWNLEETECYTVLHNRSVIEKNSDTILRHLFLHADKKTVCFLRFLFAVVDQYVRRGWFE